MEQEPIRECLVRDHRVHEGNCSHEAKVWQRTLLESHPLELRVEGWVGHPLPGEDYHSRRVQRGYWKKRLHCRLLAAVQRPRPASVGLALPFNVFGDLLYDPLNLFVADFGMGHGEFLGVYPAIIISCSRRNTPHGIQWAHPCDGGSKPASW